MGFLVILFRALTKVIVVILVSIILCFIWLPSWVFNQLFKLKSSYTVWLMGRLAKRDYKGSMLDMVEAKGHINRLTFNILQEKILYKMGHLSNTFLTWAIKKGKKLVESI